MRLGFGRFIKILLSSFFIQTSWSFSTLQGLGFLFNLTIAAKKDKRPKVIETHKGFFNTHPYMSSYIVGAVTRAYDDNQYTTEEIHKFINIAQTSFASAGDLLFWEILRPALLLISTIIALKFGIIGPLIFITVYTIFHLYHRIQGIYDGYNMKWDVIYILKSKRFTTTQYIFELLGAFCSGLLISAVSLEVSYLLIVPLSILFIMLLLRKVPSVVIAFVVILLIIVIIWVGI
jgi:mannose/fructose/N-acetylgalactosamine-specific phosphotransferase system component IID